MILLITVLVSSGLAAAVALASWRKYRKHPKGNKVELISLLVPFRADYPERERNWEWLRKYWAHEMPEAEVIVGTDESTPFCKTHAVNNAFSKSKGDVIVILDADCYISGDAIRSCAKQIRAARKAGRRLWFLPYRRFYRLREEASLRLLSSDPAHPLRFADPPSAGDLETPGGVSFGHWYAAMIQVMPREAFTAAGGMDEKFSGWGGEDLAFMQAIDTLYGPHKTLNGPVYHICHPVIKGAWQATRQWVGQTEPEMNDWLSGRYTYANGDKKMMRDLIAGKNIYAPGS